MKFSPLGDRVVIRPIDEGNKKGSLYIPENAKQKPIKGRVVDIGPAATQLSIGKEVLYGKYSGTEVTFEDIDYVFILEDEVLAIIQ